MAWELLAIWLIVAVTIVWFFRDEKRARSDAEIKRAARYYAHAPKYRHVSVEPLDGPTPLLRQRGGLTPEQRALIAALTNPREPASTP